MTAAHETNEIDGPHEGPIKTPKQLILAVFYAFVVPIFAIVLLVMYVTTETRPAAGSDASAPKSIAERIRPVGTVEVKDATDLASMKTGEQVYAAQCTACHATGALDAPKIGDAAAWAPRIKAGFDAPGPLVDRRQGRDAGAGRRRLQRLRDRPRRGPHRQPERRQVPGAEGPGRRRERRRPRDDRRRARDTGGTDDRRRAGRTHPGRSSRSGDRPCRRRRDAGRLHRGLPGLPRGGRRRRAEDRRQGRLGAAPRPGRRRDGRRASSRARARCRRAAPPPRPTPRSRPSSTGW